MGVTELIMFGAAGFGITELVMWFIDESFYKIFHIIKIVRDHRSKSGSRTEHTTTLKLECNIRPCHCTHLREERRPLFKV